MRVQAVRVIRSAHLDACIHKAGEVGELLRKMKRFDSEIYLIRWSDGSECVVVPADVEEIVDAAAPAEHILLTVMPEQSAIEAASSSCREPVPATSGMTGQEPAGTLPLFSKQCLTALERTSLQDGFGCFDPCLSCGWFHPNFDLGGEG